MDGVIVTYTGVEIEPLRPDPALIRIEDIAHALSNNCRFTGHVREFYSVAQHSVYVSRHVPSEDALEGLLHDASEAYLSDIARPVKMQPEFGAVYKTAEERLERAIAKRFDLVWPWPESVRSADNVLLRTEQRDLMPGLRHLEGEEFYCIPETPIKGWSPARARTAFLSRYLALEGS